MREEEIEYVDHDGKIVSVNPGKGTVTVSLIEEADCGECPASKLCNNFAPDKNVVEVPVSDTADFRVGEIVGVRGSERLHRKAILLVTVIPSLALIAVMIGIYLLTGSQLAACLSAIGAMIVFFFGLYLIRHKLAHEFVFEIVREEDGVVLERQENTKGKITDFHKNEKESND